MKKVMMADIVSKQYYGGMNSANEVKEYAVKKSIRKLGFNGSTFFIQRMLDVLCIGGETSRQYYRISRGQASMANAYVGIQADVEDPKLPPAQNDHNQPGVWRFEIPPCFSPEYNQ